MNFGKYNFRFVDFDEDASFMGVFSKPVNEKKGPRQQCFPLFSFIKALDHPTINLLRFDNIKIFKTLLEINIFPVWILRVLNLKF